MRPFWPINWAGRGHRRVARLERERRSWVPGPEAMKKYVWSETVVKGGKPFTGTLAHPPTNNGPFQNLPAASSAFSDPQFYADSTVVAYRVLATAAPQPKITWSGGADGTDGR